MNFELPFGSALDIQFKKVFDFSFSGTQYKETSIVDGRSDTLSFSLAQETQLRMKGKMLDRLYVNVDYNDISDGVDSFLIRYEGKGNEFIQDIHLGDIEELSIPSSYFIGYSKSAFGLKSKFQIQPKSLVSNGSILSQILPSTITYHFIASQNQGETKVKKFLGRSEFKKVQIPDIDYIRRKYYGLQISIITQLYQIDRNAIEASGISVYLDDNNVGTNNSNDLRREYIIVSTSGHVSISTGIFRELFPNQDYILDFQKSIIEFTSNLSKEDVIIIDYIHAGTSKSISQLISEGNGISNSSISGILLKPDETNTLPVHFENLEIKSYYDIGSSNIIRDSDSGNFIFSLQDKNQNEVDHPLIVYPDTVEVDFEKGIFHITVSSDNTMPHFRPFSSNIYGYIDNIPDVENTYDFYIEYYIKQGIFNLSSGQIVEQSERVVIDGTRLIRNIDYFIDYDIGVVTLYDTTNILDISVIEITFDQALFGGVGRRTFLGNRLEIFQSNNVFLGFTALYQYSPRPDFIPSLGMLPQNNLILEADFNIKDIFLFNKKLNITNTTAEVIESIVNSNIYGQAMVQSFENQQVTTNVNLNEDVWFIASPPTNVDRDGVILYSSLENELVNFETILTRDFTLKDYIITDSTLQVLKIGYAFEANSTDTQSVSVGTLISRTGIDFYTNKQETILLWIRGDNSNHRFQLQIGNIPEDVDGDGEKDSEDIDVSGTLGENEDIGWEHDILNQRIGVDNNRIDTEDWDGDGRLDNEDSGIKLGMDEYQSFRYYDVQNNQLISSSSMRFDWSGWRLFEIPVDINDSNMEEFQSVKHVRLTIIQDSDTNLEGNIAIGKIRILGTLFDDVIIEPNDGSVISSATVVLRNNYDHPTYPTLVNNSDYQSLHNNIIPLQDQSVGIVYTPVDSHQSTGVITTKFIISQKSRDFTTHKVLSFFLYGDNSENEFLLRIGSQDNYFEYTTKLDFSQWKQIRLNIEDVNRDGQIDKRISIANGVLTVGKGNPTLTGISDVTLGVIVSSSSVSNTDGVQRIIYVNDIHLSDPLTLVGTAYRFTTNATLDKFGQIGFNFISRDRFFRTLSVTNTGVDDVDYDINFSLIRFSFFPLHVHLSNSKTVSFLTQSSALESTLSEGIVRNNSQTVSSNLFLTKLPFFPDKIRKNLLDFSLSFKHDSSKNFILQREADKISFGLNTAYSFPWKLRKAVKKRKFYLFPEQTRYNFSFLKDTVKEQTLTHSFSYTHNLSTDFIHNSILHIYHSYFLKIVNRDLNFTDTVFKYPLERQQDYSFNGDIKIFQFFKPTFNYGVSFRENYTFDNNIVQKDLRRDSNSNVSFALRYMDLTRKFKFLSFSKSIFDSISISGSINYNIDDSFSNLDSGYSDFNRWYIVGDMLDLSQMVNAKRNSFNTSHRRDLSLKWVPFQYAKIKWKRMLYIFKNVRLSNRFAYSKDYSLTNDSQSLILTREYPLNLSTSHVFDLFFLHWLIPRSNFNLIYSRRNQETVNRKVVEEENLSIDILAAFIKKIQISFKFQNRKRLDIDLDINRVTLDSSIDTYNIQILSNFKFTFEDKQGLVKQYWVFTPSYKNTFSHVVDGTGRLTSNSQENIIALHINGDIAVPVVLQLLLVRDLALQNRLILTINTTYRDFINRIDILKNLRELNIKATASIDINKNLSSSVGATFTNLDYTEDPSLNHFRYSVNGKITIQF